MEDNKQHAQSGNENQIPRTIGKHEAVSAEDIAAIRAANAAKGHAVSPEKRIPETAQKNDTTPSNEVPKKSSVKKITTKEKLPQESDNTKSSNTADEKGKGKKKKSTPEKILDKLIMVAAIIVTLGIVVIIALNAPIVAYTTTENGKKSTHNISLMSYYKEWKPLVNIEGSLKELNDDEIDLATKSNDNSNPNKEKNVERETQKNDGLDLKQNIEGQYTVLFLGMDEGGIRSDVNWVVQIDLLKQRMNILQIPRDTYIPDYTDADTGKFNSIYYFGDKSKSSIQRVVDAVRENYGFVVDAYVTTECDQIPDIVDAAGGIPINLPQKIVYEADKVLPAGKQTLNGQQSEWFVRFRHGYSEGDIGRIQAQRIFMAAAFKKAANMSSTQRMSTLKKIYKNKWMATNLSIEDIGRLGDFLSVLKMDNVDIYMLPGEGATLYGQSLWSTHKKAAIDLLNKEFRPYQNKLDYDSSPIYEVVGEDHYQDTEYDDRNSSLKEVEDDAEKKSEETTEYDTSQ